MAAETSTSEIWALGLFWLLMAPVSALVAPVSALVERLPIYVCRCLHLYVFIEGLFGGLCVFIGGLFGMCASV